LCGQYVYPKSSRFSPSVLSHLFRFTFFLRRSFLSPGMLHLPRKDASNPTRWQETARCFALLRSIRWVSPQDLNAKSM